MWKKKKHKHQNRDKTQFSGLRKRWIRFLALVIYVTYFVSCLGNPPPVLAVEPLVCDSTLYISQAVNADDPTQLFRLNRETFLLEEIGVLPDPMTDPNNPRLQVRYNAMGFNVLDGFIYGIDPDNPQGVTPKAQTVYRIGQNGEVEELGIPSDPQWPAPDPGDGRFFAGDFNGQGDYLIYSARLGQLYTLRMPTPPSTAAPTVLGFVPVLNSNPPPNGIVDYADLAFNPVDGKLYGIRSDNTRQLSAINITTGDVEEIPTRRSGNPPTPGKLPGSAPVGAVFFDAFGNLFTYDNSGVLYLIELETENDQRWGTFTELGRPQSVSRNDGAACAYAIKMEKTVSPEQVFAGQTVTYTYRIVNRTRPLGPLGGLTFSDILTDERTFVPGSLRISPNGVTGTPNNFGNTSTLRIDNLTLPADTVAEINVDVNIPLNTPAGTIFNQATLAGVPENFDGPEILSDYPPSGGFPDETPLDIVESPAIGVAKQVANNVDNGDGTHTVTYNIKVDNLGNTSLEDVSLTENLADTFNGVDDFTVDSISLESITEGNLTVNQNFNGEGDTSLLNNSQTQRLEFNGTATIQLVVTVTPGSNLGPFENTVAATATSPGPNGTPVDDESDNGTETDPNPDDGNPGGGPDEDDPTPVTFGGGDNPAIGVAKSLGAVTPLGGGRF
ncbi:MAG: DUF6923 family protein, partial [Coleofasciculus sp.]